MRGYRMALLRSGIDNALLNAEGCVILAQLLYEVCKERRDERKKAQEEKRKKEYEEWKYRGISDAIKTQIFVIGKAGEEDFTNHMIVGARRANLWLDDVFRYMTNPNASLWNEDDVTIRQLVNGVVQLFGFEKVYDSDEVADLTRYDIFHENFEPSSRYVISIEEIKERGNQCKELIASRKKQMAAIESMVDFIEEIDLKGVDIESVMDEVRSESRRKKRMAIKASIVDFMEGMDLEGVDIESVMYEVKSKLSSAEPKEEL